MHALRFWIRWSARDLRRRWIQVAAVALILAVGSGLYAGLGGTSVWRKQSNDASFAALRMYDVRVRLTAGSQETQGSLLEVVGHLPHAEWVARAEERLILPTQIDASSKDKTILVPGRLVGMNTGNDGPLVNTLYLTSGTGRLDLGTAVLDHAFRKFYKLPNQGILTVGSGSKLRYTGTGVSPETFIVTSDRGDVLGAANLAVVFASLDTVRQVSGRPEQVNDLVIRMSSDIKARDVKGSNREILAKEVKQAFAELHPELGVTVMGPEDDEVHRILYEDAKSDQQMLNVFAFLVLGGAALAAFNLANRMVESQRREIGIGMALGLRPAAIAMRPLLVGAEIGLLSLVFGVGVGLVFAEIMKSLYTSLLPMPIWLMRFQFSYFAQAAALGFVIPIVACAWPVWRAIRVAPIEAIRTGPLSNKGNGLAPLLRRVPLPGRSFAQMPARNILRTPRRTLTTALGIGAAVTTIVATLGLLDTLLLTIDRGDREVLQGSPERLTADLDGFFPVAGAELSGVRAKKQVGTVEPGLRLGGIITSNARGEKKSVKVLIDTIDFRGHPLWAPTVVAGSAPAGVRGLVLSEKAGRDLGVGIGDTVMLQHPVRQGEYAYRFATTPITVTGLHPSPFRFLAFVDASQAGLFGLEGRTNTVQVAPAPGFGDGDVQRALFGLPGVASVQPASAMGKVVRDTVDEYQGILRVIQGFVFILALLVAFNATSINADERAREHATMFAFGLHVRTVLRMSIIESLVVGLLGTLLGCALGATVLQWMATSLFPRTLPELGIDPTLSVGTIATVFALGVAAVAVAPLLTLRRLRRMDIPGNLRVME